MASDLKKPDFTTTLFPIEIREKMWHLPVEDPFIVDGITIWKYANGIENSEVRKSNFIDLKIKTLRE